MKCSKASPMSRYQIRRVAQYVRKLAGMDNDLYFPIVEFVEKVLPILFEDFVFEVCSKTEMGNKHGETFPNKNIIRIREDVYEGAVKGRGRDRMTLAHEVGHLFMHEEDSISLCRLAPGKKLEPYEDPEWQAKAFGGELLAPVEMIKRMSLGEVQRKCGVSEDAARQQLKHCNE